MSMRQQAPMRFASARLSDLRTLDPYSVRALDATCLFELYKRARHHDAIAVLPGMALFVQDRLDSWDVAALASKAHHRLRKRIRPGTLAAAHLPRLAAGLAGWTHPALPIPAPIPEPLPITSPAPPPRDVRAWFQPGVFQDDAPWEVWLNVSALVSVGALPPEALTAVEQVAFGEGEVESDVTTLAEMVAPGFPIAGLIESCVALARCGLMVWRPDTQCVGAPDVIPPPPPRRATHPDRP